MNVPDGILPVRHLAITADGNGRWAQSRGLPRSVGHSRGVDAFESVVETSASLGIEYLSIHVLSPENWRRPKEELQYILKVIESVVTTVSERLNSLSVRFKWVGSKSRMPTSLLDAIRRLEISTAKNPGMRLQLCINYGGRTEIFEAARTLAEACVDGEVDVQHLTEADFTEALYAPEVPDIDLYIRAGGRVRFSNFGLWQAAYAELIFTDKLWPDFRGHDIVNALEEYSSRERTLGGLSS